MKNNNLKIAVVDMDVYKVVDYIVIGNVIYKSNQLSNSELSLTTAMIYEPFKCSVEYYDAIAHMIGYDHVLAAIQSLMDKGANIATDEIYRQLVMNNFKIKHKGLMR